MRQFYTVPLSSSDYSTGNRIMELAMLEDLKLSGKVKEELTGHWGRQICLLKGQKDNIQHQEEIRKQLVEIFLGAQIESVTYQKADNPRAPVTLEYKVTFSGREQLMGAKLLIQPSKYLSKTTNPFLFDKRETPLVFNHSFHNDEVLNMTLPNTWEVEALPKKASFKNEVGVCEINCVVRGQMITVQRMFQLNHAFINKEYYPSVRELFQFQKELDGATIILREKNTS